jgi:hypothetical protein
MNTLAYNTIALLIGALMFVPLSPSTVRADDDDDWDDDDDGRWERRGWYRSRPYGYREYYYPAPRYYRSYRGPVYRDYYPERRVYRYYDRYPRYYYGGRVHAGPADVYYGRHGAVRVGPLHVYW